MVRDVVCMFPIQFGKTMIAANGLAYCMDYNPGPIMVALLVWRHRSNIRNLLAGTEDKIGTDHPDG